MAGIDWLYAFRKRHSNLKPCSLSRAMAFNKHNVGLFFDNLETVLKCDPSLSDGTRIFNLDEIGTSTVQNPKKILTPKGAKQLNKATSDEKETFVITCCIISASGVALPQAMVFPRIRFKEFMLKGTPPDTLGLAAQSGWMNSELFARVMQNFVKVSFSSKEKPSLLILDNHESRLSITEFGYCEG
ncbi:hypothetical protein PR048_009204 [Dryococelus australis]|uniref:DDE-1 domain-containing protein n=1 Tax=Dryococelus australis TaxID=614101 RepID=A0ABQ9I132_9NEOP|nr:hypothetical protein PR048_009204 [Dryococelus australis]